MGSKKNLWRPLVAKPEREMAGRNRILVEGLRSTVLESMASVGFLQLEISHTEFSMIFDRREPLCITPDREYTKDGVVQSNRLTDITNVLVRIEVTSSKFQKGQGVCCIAP